VDEYTEKATRLNRAKEIILRAQGLSDDSTSPLDRCVNEQSTALPLLRPGQRRPASASLLSQRVPLAPSVQPPACDSHFSFVLRYVACESSFEPWGAVLQTTHSQEADGARDTAGDSASVTAGAAAAAPGPRSLQQLLEREINNLASSPFSMISPVDKGDSGTLPSRAGATDVPATPGLTSPSPSESTAAARPSDSIPIQVRSPKK